MTKAKILISSLALFCASTLGPQALAQDIIGVPADDGVIDTNHKPKTLDIGRPLSHSVNFKPGKSQFQGGDAITITEITGTSSKLSIGNSFQIKGTYTLASHPSATLAVYTTTEIKNGNDNGPYGNNQMNVEKGTGQFTLSFPIRKEGQTHVSFYPSKGGESFGGLYFKN